MPGHLLRRVAAAVCCPKTLERLVDPILADLQAEVADIATQRGWKRRLSLWRGNLALWKALAVHCLVEMFRPARWESSGTRMVAFSVMSFIALTIFLMLPPLIDYPWRGTLAERILIVSLLVPQALPVTIPAGTCVGIVCAMRGRRATTRSLVAVLSLAAVATFAVWAAMERGLPAANQRFREVVAAQLGDGVAVHMEPGRSELGLSRLSQRTDPLAIRTSRLLWALCFATTPLALFAFGLSAQVRRFATAVAISLLAPIIYLLGMMAVEALRDGALRAIAVWLPNLTFVVAGALLLRHGRTRLGTNGQLTA
jgi:hypothetical protein